jgi:predicted DCC family thiol-disulfide oxidoreductase YuxK
METVKNIVFFDGVCGLCNSFIDYIILQDVEKKLFYAPLQGITAQEKLEQNPLSQNTVIFIYNNKIYIKSTAAIRIFASLGGIWKLSLMFLIIPTFIRDYIYSFIAKRRYKWFGIKETCRVPSLEERNRFLD